MLSQLAPMPALQKQLFDVATSKLDEPPAFGKVAPVGVRLNVQPLPFCATRNVVPWTERLAQRRLEVVFAARVKSMVPLPVPLPPELIVIQLGTPVTVQLQPA